MHSGHITIVLTLLLSFVWEPLPLFASAVTHEPVKYLRLRTRPVPTGTTTVREMPIFDPKGPGFEPLDIHTESRLKRYLKREHCPVTYDEVEKLRCQYLLNEKRYNDQLRSTSGLMGRGRRHVLAEEEKEPVLEEEGLLEKPFDPSGPGALPLDRLSEQRVKRYVSNFNCPSDRLHKQNERDRCIYLLRQHEELRKEVTGGRKHRSRRTVRDPMSMDEREFMKRQLTDADLAGLEALKGEVSVEIFDRSGPGSTPLPESVENRLNRYVNEGNCPQTSDDAIRVRCAFLLRLRQYGRSGELSRVEGKVRLRELELSQESTQLLQKGVGQSSESVVEKMKRYGHGIRPRTLQEVQTKFGSGAFIRERREIRSTTIYGGGE